MKTLLSKFSVLSTLVLISFLFLSFSQGVVWLDENHNQVTQDNGKFYRPFPEKKRNVYLIVDFYKNGTIQNSGTAAFTDMITATTEPWLPAVKLYGEAISINFGNPSYTIASGNSDANGYGNFEYAVPSGYYALCTKNLGAYGG